MRATKSTNRDSRRRVAYERQRQQHQQGASRLALRNEARAAAQHAADAVAALEIRWGSRADALERLREVGEAMAQIDLQERRLRSERDQLIDDLRAVGESWNSLASRTGLSRRALMKRRGNVAGLA
jgi:hypothetical protein